MVEPIATPEKMAMLANRFRLASVQLMAEGSTGHYGGCLSAAEIITTLYFGVLRVNPADPTWPDRDRFILAKGHAGPVLYPVLAERGYFPKGMLAELDKPGGRLPKHVDRLKCPGIEMSSGCLALGLSVGVGMALAGRADGKGYRVYVLMGDGELDSGQVWEAAMAASKYRLDNLVAIVDRNEIQIDGSTDTEERVMPLEPLADKWRAFGWHVIECDGHDVVDLLATFRLAGTHRIGPVVVLAHTVKGKGVSFMERNKDWHARVISADEARLAIRELSALEGVDDA